MSSQFAQEIGVNPKQPFAYDLRKPCFERLWDFLSDAIYNGPLTSDGNGRLRTTYDAVLMAAVALGERGGQFARISSAAYGLSRSISSARLCPVASMRVKAYKPYRLCQLLERIAAECPTLCSAEVDEWLRSHREEL
jgi:hypothetical protein